MSCPPGSKYDNGKDRWDLVPWASLREVARVLTYGAGKYADPETGLPHLAHAATCILFLLWFDVRGAA